MGEVRKKVGFRNRWLLLAATVGLSAVVGVMLLLVLSPNEEAPEASAGSPGATTAQQSDLSVFERRSEDDLLTAGPVDAPGALIVFSDYQCPYCARWNAAAMPDLLDLAEQGALRIEWRDANVLGPDSERAARASYAAAKQGAFWEYHDALFANGQARSAGQLTDEALVALASDLGLDTSRFEADLRSDEAANEIAQNTQLARTLNVPSTPSFVLDGEPIVGSDSVPRFLEYAEQNRQ